MRLHRRKQFHKQRLVQLFRELRRSTAALPDGVIILSTQNEIVWFNRQAARLLGLRRPVDIGLRIDNLIRSPEFVLYLHGDDFAMPLVIRPPVQADLYLALQLVPYGGGQSLLLVRDVTRQMRLEAMRKDFVANASHELRTPLTVISGYLDTMADDSAIDQAWAGPIRDMRAQAQRMNAIITDLLELSRLESTDGEAPREPIDVPGMLERMHRDALAGGGRPRHVLLELESADGLFGAPHEIESAFTNLLVNGLKYTPVDGTVRMRWWIDEDGAHFAVIDTGIGISAEHIPRLTERFYRVDAGRSRGRGRLRARSCDRQACHAAPWRLARRSKHRRQGKRIYLSFSRAEDQRGCAGDGRRERHDDAANGRGAAMDATSYHKSLQLLTSRSNRM